MENETLEVIAEVFFKADSSYLLLLCSDNQLYHPARDIKSYIKPFERSSIGPPCSLSFDQIEPFCKYEMKDGTTFYGSKWGEKNG